jgi:hypothetical protein
VTSPADSDLDSATADVFEDSINTFFIDGPQSLP